MKNIILLAAMSFAMSTTGIVMAAPEPETLNLKPETINMGNFEIIPVEAAPVALELAKKHLNVDADFTDDDDLIQMYIDGAAQDAANYIGRPLAENRIYNRSGFDTFDFTAYAVAAVSSVQYATLNDDGAVEYVDLAPQNYIVRQLGNYTMEIRFKFDGEAPLLPSGVENPVRVNVSTTCPARVVGGILLKVGQAYERREDNASAVDNTVALNAWRPYRLFN